MNKVLKMVLVLSITGAVSGGILAKVFHFADPLIQENRRKALEEAIFIVLPEAKKFEPIEKEVDKVKIVIYKGIDANGTPVGIAFEANGGGFQGNIKIMVGLNADFLKLKAIKILEQSETPGLGNRIQEPAFEGQFMNLEIKPKIEYIKYRKPEKPNQIQAITGATISSDAVVKNINNAVSRVLKNFTKEEILTAVEIKK